MPNPDKISQSRISSSAFWPMMSLVQPYAHIFTQGLFIMPKDEKPGAQIICGNHYRAAIFHDAGAEVAGAIFIPRPKPLHPPANSWARNAGGSVLIEESAKTIAISYTDPKNEPRTIQVDYPAIHTHMPGWRDIIRPDELLPISVLETEQARRDIRVNANSVGFFTRAFGHNLEQFAMMVKVGMKKGEPRQFAPAWFAIGHNPDVLVMHAASDAADQYKGAVQGPQLKGKAFDYDKLPKVPEAELPRVKAKILELIA